MKTENFKCDISGLEQLSDALGYKETSFHLQMSKGDRVIDLQSVLNFLEDNPGAIEAVFQWAEDNFSNELADNECHECGEDTDDCDCIAELE